MAEPAHILVASVLLSSIAYHQVSALIPALAPTLVDKGLAGQDMLKPGFVRKQQGTGNGNTQNKENKNNNEKDKPKVKLLPEATGVIAASVYILLLSLFAPLPYLSHLVPPALRTSLLPSLNLTAIVDTITGRHHNSPPIVDPSKLLDGSIAFPHHSFATYLASLLSLLTATFLGFLDDVFDIRWRFKVPIPIIASVPLLVTYAAGQGITDVVLPKILGLRWLFNVESTNGVVNLGPLYYIYMSLLSTFCTNSINILAGVNGVEVGQALIIALSIALNDILYLSFDISAFLYSSSSPREPYVVGLGLARGSAELADRHLFSLYFMLPLIGVCCGLLRHNWYPARAFVGDTFCYFAGMAFAVVGILGHFSKTLLLFFIPQIFNFLYSLPQLAGIIPCPRHRLPVLNERTGKLEPSLVVLSKRPNFLLRWVLECLGKCRLVRLDKDDKGTIVRMSNLTILNLILVVCGEMREDTLTLSLMGLQVAGSVVAFGVRYGVAGWFYDASRR
ncbi:hypothetical protein T439DRAFT_313240 [Meredithblackwellia eburnea MCA 4105]